MSELRLDLKRPDRPTVHEQKLLIELAPRVAEIVRSYFTPDGKVNTELGAEVLLEQNIGGIELIARAQRKRTTEPRRNEDVVRLDDVVPLYVVADGVSGGEKGRNVSALMGEVAAVVAPEQLRRLHEAQAPAEVIKQALRRIPELCRLALVRALKDSSMEALGNVVQPQFLDGYRVYSEGDYSRSEFATTLDLVYVAKHLQIVFGLHVGNGKTFALFPRPDDDPTVVSLTHVHTDAEDRLASCVALDAGAATEIDVFEAQLVPGMMIVTVTDGLYQAYEAKFPERSFGYYLSVLDSPTQQPKELKHVLGQIMAAAQLQTDVTRDDAAAALLRLPK